MLRFFFSLPDSVDTRHGRDEATKSIAQSGCQCSTEVHRILGTILKTLSAATKSLPAAAAAKSEQVEQQKIEMTELALRESGLLSNSRADVRLAAERARAREMELLAKKYEKEVERLVEERAALQQRLEKWEILEQVHRIIPLTLADSSV